METELKLTLKPADLDRMRAHPLLAAHAVAGPVDNQHVDTYYDTPDQALWQHGLTLRVRAQDGGWIQTVKTANGPSAALHQRGEWECALPDARPRPAQLARQIKPAKLAALLKDTNLICRLQPVFSASTRRTTWDIQLPDGERVECALDAGSLESGGQHASIAELELEMKQGVPRQLFDFALSLHESVPLHLANDSKAARGFALIAPAAPVVVKARPVHLTRKMTLEDAFRCIGLNCLEQMEANVGGVLARSVESLHQMRVGLRRLRALLDMFGDLAAPPAAMSEGIEWLAGELGATRDWDVLAGSTLKRIDGIDPAVVREAARAKAAKLHAHLLTTLDAPRFTELVLQLNGWLLGRQWRENGALPKGAPLKAPVGRAVRPLLDKAEKRLGKRIAALDPADAPARHRVRIAAKKARYAAEFFSDILQQKTIKPYVRALSALQDRLGPLNDMAVADHLLPELQHGSNELARQAAFARGYLLAAEKAEAGKLRKPLKAVARLRMTR